MTPPRLRIAPSPTGDPHVGTAYVALFNVAFARKHGGTFLLRIEDTDRVRSTRASEQMIFDALRWLGLTYDEGPDVGGPFGPYRQSERADIYREHTQKLIEGGAAYHCFCSAQRLDEVRKVQQAAKQPTRYDGHCRNLPVEDVARMRADGSPAVVRLKVPLDGETKFTDLIRGEIVIANGQLDDQVLMKSDGFPTYHLANVVDDHLMGITHVVRAEEWIPSTPKHILLYAAFGWTPPQFAHVPLLRNQDRSKISKRKNPTSLLWYQLEGYLPDALKNFLALQGFSMPDGAEICSFQEFVDHFDLARITTSGPVFDMKKLEWLNGMYVRQFKKEELADHLSGAILSGARDPKDPMSILRELGIVTARRLRVEPISLPGIELPVRWALFPEERVKAAAELEEARKREKDGKGGLDPRYAERVEEYLKKAETVEFQNQVKASVRVACGDSAKIDSIAGLVQERLKRLTWNDLMQVAECYLPGEVQYDAALLLQRVKEPAKAVAALKQTRDRLLKDLTGLPVDILEGRALEIAETEGLAKGDFFMLLRVAVTGKTATPPLFETMQVLGATVVQERLELAIAKLAKA